MKNQAALQTPFMMRLLISIAAIATVGLLSLCIFQIGQVVPEMVSSARHELSNIAYQLLYIR